MKASDLENHERLLLSRRRKGESQPAAATRLGVTLYRYRQMEAGNAPCKRLPVGQLRPHEECFLLRRRAGMEVGQIAELIGCSNWWLIRMEKGRERPDDLVAFWKSPRGRKLAAA